MDQDKTVELVTNLDRAAIEEKLRQIVAAAKAHAARGRGAAARPASRA